MAVSTIPERSSRYLIRWRDSSPLGELVETLKADSKIQVLDEIGPTGQPHTLVAMMSDEQAAALRARHLGRLLVEPDRPLKLQDIDFG